MKRPLPMIVLMALVWAGCGGKKNSSSTTVAITISPTTASLAGGATQQFTATVTNTTNTAVNWQVNGEAGGDATIGTVSSTGLYTAPTVLPSTTTIAVTAVSQADTTKTATATVTLTAPPIVISINPTTITLGPGQQQQFTATITGGTKNTASWSVNGGSALGTIDQTGLYSAPLSPPKEAITVTATSTDNSAFTAKANITVQFGTGSLKGNYVFLATQADNSSGTGFAFHAGVFTADGNGNITGGATDSNSSGTGPQNAAISSGTYSIGTDGRGTLTFTDSNGSHKFAFALTSNTRGQLIEFDNAGVVSGYIRQQDQTAISALNGQFVFGVSGDNSGPYAAVGQIVFTSNLNPPAISGSGDSNDRGTTGQFVLGGSYSIGASGRVAASISGLGTGTFVFYIIDASTFTLLDVGNSGAPRTAGTAYAQSIGAITNSSLMSSVYFTTGKTVSGPCTTTPCKPYGQAGRFDTNASAGQLSGIFDVNSGGTLSSATTFNGTSYMVLTASAGRGRMSNGTSNFIFYLASSKLGVILQTDSAIVASGLILQQAAAPSITGGFEFVVAGASADGTTPQAIEAQATTSGFGILSGTADANTGGNLSPVSPSPSLAGSISIGANGRGTSNGNIKATGVNNQIVFSDSYILYFVTPDRFILLTNDPNSVLSGIAERQCSDCSF